MPTTPRHELHEATPGEVSATPARTRRRLAIKVLKTRGVKGRGRRK